MGAGTRRTWFLTYPTFQRCRCVGVFIHSSRFKMEKVKYRCLFIIAQVILFILLQLTSLLFYEFISFSEHVSTVNILNSRTAFSYEILFMIGVVIKALFILFLWIQLVM